MLLFLIISKISYNIERLHLFYLIFKYKTNLTQDILVNYLKYKNLIMTYDEDFGELVLVTGDFHIP